MQFATVEGKRYNLERTGDFGGWLPVIENMDGTGGIMEVLDSSPPLGGGYYRVRLVP